MNDSDTSYRVFIVRCWQDEELSAAETAGDLSRAVESSETSTAVSRFVLEIPRTGERYGFTTADTLLAALHIHLNVPEKGQPSL